MNETAVKFGYPETRLAESEHWLVLLRPAQVTLGSLILCCKDEAGRLGEISDAAAAELKTMAARIEAALKGAFDHDKINYLMLMMVDPDVHFHVFPRYEAPRDFAGASFADRFWPGPPDVTSPLEMDDAAKQQLAAELRAHFG